MDDISENKVLRVFCCKAKLIKIHCLLSIIKTSSHLTVFLKMTSLTRITRRFFSMTDREKRIYPQVEQTIVDGFPILKFKPSGRSIFDPKPKYRRRVSRLVGKPREQKMTDTIDWPSMWPTAKTFIPSAVPLPLRQSYESKPGRVPRGKYANTELLKIPNFLHLTPGAIAKHCQAIKKFCTKWPENLDTDEEVRSHFPVTYVSRDYLHSSPSIRDYRARTVHIRVNIDDLNLDDRQRDKMIILAGHRYDEESNTVDIKADACPVRIQNRDYADYLLTALYFESKKYETWEDQKTEDDWAVKPKRETVDDVDSYRLEVEKKLGLEKRA